MEEKWTEVGLGLLLRSSWFNSREKREGFGKSFDNYSGLIRAQAQHFRSNGRPCSGKGPSKGDVFREDRTLIRNKSLFGGSVGGICG